MEKLSPKQDKFCREYLISSNATKAAIKAGYSLKTANEQGARLLANVSIKEHLQALNSNLLESLNLSAIMIANEIKKIAFANIGETRSDWQTLKDYESMPGDLKSAIAEITAQEKTKTGKGGRQVKNQSFKVKMHDKLRALELLSKMCGVSGSERIELTGKDCQALSNEITHKVIFVDFSESSNSQIE